METITRLGCAMVQAVSHQSLTAEVMWWKWQWKVCPLSI